MVSTRSVAVVAFGSCAGEPEADDPRDQHRDRLAEHGRLRLDAADAPAEDAEAVLHGGVAVGADAGVGVAPSSPLVITTRARCSMFTWCTMPVPGGTTRKPANASWPQRRNWNRSELRWNSSSTLRLEGLGHAEDVGHHRVVDDQLGRNERVDLGRVAAQGLHRLAHGGQVDDGGHAGQVLQDHPGRGELDLGVRLRVRVPVGQGVDVVGGDVEAVFVAEQVLEQHLQAVREVRYARDRVQAVDLVRRAARLKRRAAAEAVRSHRWLSLLAQSCVCSHCSSSVRAVHRRLFVVHASAVSPVA